jgi:hypothetical protein
LRQDEVSFHQMQREFDKLLDDGEFGFPNVFFSLALARNFYSKYLRHLPDVKLLSIALPKDYWEAFIREFAPVGNVAENGVRQKLRARCPLEPEASFRGFEILGHDYASFCSFVCHALEGDYDKALGIALNTNGLINSYQDAVRAADYTMLDEVGAEPLLWQPWLISEYALKARLSVRKQKG